MIPPIEPGSKERPLPVDGNVIHFHDWRYISSGIPGWRSPLPSQGGYDEVAILPDTLANVNEKAEINLYDFPCTLPPRDAWHVPRGVRIEARRPEVIPVEGIRMGRALIRREEGVYRSWYVRTLEGADPGFGFAICYAESDDAMAWRTPDLGRIGQPTLDGGKNAVHQPATGMHGPGLFVDPGGDPSERFKAIYSARTTREVIDAYHRRRNDTGGIAYETKSGSYAVFGSVSPDGLSWTDIEEPLQVRQSDTGNVCVYDETLGKYVAYLRMRYLHRRAIGISISDDFRNLPQPDVIDFGWSGGDLHPAHQWYGPYIKDVLPGTRTQHIMLPLLWTVETDLFHTYLATSYEGRRWALLPGGPILAPGETGAPDAGGYQATGSLTELPDGRWGVLVTSCSMPHKYPFRPSHPPNVYGWAVWPRDRMAGLVAQTEGWFSTPILSFEGNSLAVDALTDFVGGVEIEVRDGNHAPYPGRSFADCDPVIGNVAGKTVTWNGESALRPEGSGPVTLGVRMRHAKLFSLRFS